MSAHQYCPGHPGQPEPTGGPEDLRADECPVCLGLVPEPRPGDHRFGGLETRGEGAEREYRWACACAEAGPWTTKEDAWGGALAHAMTFLPRLVARLLANRRVPPCPICQAPGGFHDAAPHAGSLVFGDTPAGWRQTGVTPLVDGAVVHHYVDEDGRPHAVEVKV